MNPEVFGAILNGLQVFCGSMISQLSSPLGLEMLSKQMGKSVGKISSLPQVSSRVHA